MTDDPPDWRRLAPHRPLSPSAVEYVQRPTDGGDSIAKWVLAGGNAVLVGGPVGVGKSTEMARAARALQADRIACLVPIDRMANIRALTADEALRLIGGRVYEIATQHLKMPLSNALGVGIISPSSAPNVFRASSPAATRAILDEVSRLSHQGRIALLIDGLEKVAPGAEAADVFDALGGLPSYVDLVVIIPWDVAVTRRGDNVVRAGERFIAVRPLDTLGELGVKTAEFLGKVVARRLRGDDEVPEPLVPLIRPAVEASGGIPRVFLQLLADAATYARVKRDAGWPDASDLDDAIADQRESLRRLLMPGDTAAIQRVVGTDGRELELERRVRLMAHGILLERLQDGKPHIEVHPLTPLAA